MGKHEIANKNTLREPGRHKGGRYIKKDHAGVQKNVLAYLHDLVFLLAIILLLLLLLFRVVIVSGPSMNDTLVHGDYLILLNNVFYGKPEQGDVIVASKDSFKDGEPIIKRVIATEGQTVDIDFSKGIVYVDNVALEEDYIKCATTRPEGMRFPLEVKEGCVFVMGDNRDNSMDSRDPDIGLIDEREIIGRAVFLTFPGKTPGTDKRDFSRIGAL